jgi:hypothetical protein
VIVVCHGSSFSTLRDATLTIGVTQTRLCPLRTWRDASEWRIGNVIPLVETGRVCVLDDLHEAVRAVELGDAVDGCKLEAVVEDPKPLRTTIVLKGVQARPNRGLKLSASCGNDDGIWL